MAAGLKELIAEAKADAREIAPTEVQEGLDRGDIALVVDVREPNEFAAGRLPGAVNVPRGVLELRADPNSPSTDPQLSGDRDANVVVYCTKAPGARTLFAAATLRRMGYANVLAMTAGVDGWREAGLPVVSG